MATIFSITAPFYGLIALGYLALHWGFLQLDAIKPLNTFVLFIALPAMLFRFGVQLPIADLLDGQSLLLYAASAAVMVAVSVSLSWRFERPRHSGSTGFAALVASFPNTGFLGLPLLTTLLGTQAAGPILVSLVFDLVITSTVCVALALSGAATASGGNIQQAKIMHPVLRQVALGLLKNPMPWAILAGAWCSWQSLEPSPILQGVIYRLADAASPVALFMIGAVIYRARHLARQPAMQRHQRAASTARPVPALSLSTVLPYTALKLWLHPLLILIFATLAAQWGLNIAAATVTTLMLLAALPSGSNVSLLAERMDGNNDRVAMVILLTTVFALPSFTLIASALGVQAS